MALALSGRAVTPNGTSGRPPFHSVSGSAHGLLHAQLPVPGQVLYQPPSTPSIPSNAAVRGNANGLAIDGNSAYRPSTPNVNAGMGMSNGTANGSAKRPPSAPLQTPQQSQIQLHTQTQTQTQPPSLSLSQAQIAIAAAAASAAGAGGSQLNTKQPYEPRPPWAYDPLAITTKKRMTPKEYQELHHLTKLPTSVAKFRNKQFSISSIEMALQNKINAHTSRDSDRFRQILRIFKEQAPKGGIGGENDRERREREEREREAERDEKEKEKASVSREEFATALALLGMFATREQANMLFDKYDENMDGILTIHEFLTRNRPKDYTEERWYEAGYLDERIGRGKKQFLRTRLSGAASRPNTPANNVFYLSFHKICSGIRRKLTGKARSGEAMSHARGRRELLRIFHFFDQQQNGYVDFEGLKKVLELINFHLNKEKQEELFNMFADPPLPSLLASHGYHVPPSNPEDDDETKPAAPLPNGFSLTTRRNFIYSKFIEHIFPDEGIEEEETSFRSALFSALLEPPATATPNESAEEEKEAAPSMQPLTPQQQQREQSLAATFSQSAVPATSLHLHHDAGKVMLEKLNDIEQSIEDAKGRKEGDTRARQVQKAWNEYWKAYTNAPPPASPNNSTLPAIPSMRNAPTPTTAAAQHQYQPPASPSPLPYNNTMLSSTPQIPLPTPTRVSYTPKQLPGPNATKSTAHAWRPLEWTPPPTTPDKHFSALATGVGAAPRVGTVGSMSASGSGWSAAGRPPSAPSAPVWHSTSSSSSSPSWTSHPIRGSSTSHPVGFAPLTPDGLANGFRPASGVSLQAAAVPSNSIPISNSSIRPRSQPYTSR